MSAGGQIFSIPDLVGVGLAFMAVALTLVAITVTVIIFFVGRRYSTHLSEIEGARKDLLGMIEKIQADMYANRSMLDELHLGIDTIIRLNQIESSMRQLSAPELTKVVQLEKIRNEKEELSRRHKSREIELSILSTGGKNCLASLNSLAYTLGDRQSIDFLDRLIGILSHRGRNTTKFSEARGMIWSRLVGEGRIG